MRVNLKSESVNVKIKVKSESVLERDGEREKEHLAPSITRAPSGESQWQETPKCTPPNVS